MSKTPKLRFKEFSGDWESKKLGTMGEFFKGSILSKANLSEEGNPCILYGELYTKYSEVIKNVISKTNLDDLKLVIGKKNDVLIPSSGETAIDIATASCLQQDNVILGGDLNVFRSDKLNGIFTSYQLNNSKRHEIAKLAQGASVVHVYNNQLTNLKLSVPSKEEQEKIASSKVTIPSIEEQEKIASFFSLIDDKISLQGENVEALKDYKSGMMQKIFSRELRFRDDDGSDYPEWEEKNLANLVRKKKKGQNAIYAEDGNILLNNEYMENNTDPMYVENEIDVDRGDILILWDGSQAGKMYTGFTGVLGSTFVAITLDEYNCNRFIYQQLMYNLDKIQIAWREGSGVPHVAKDFIENFKVKVPVWEEQIKISKILDEIDIKLKKEQEKLDYLNEYKKGLLQQMFV